jgi:hypothetical protein
MQTATCKRTTWRFSYTANDRPGQAVARRAASAGSGSKVVAGNVDGCSHEIHFREGNTSVVALCTVVPDVLGQQPTHLSRDAVHKRGIWRGDA